MSGTEEDRLAGGVVVARTVRFRLPDLHRDAVSPLDYDGVRRHPTDEHPPGPTGPARRCSPPTTTSSSASACVGLRMWIRSAWWRGAEAAVRHAQRSVEAVAWPSSEGNERFDAPAHARERHDTCKVIVAKEKYMLDIFGK